MAAMEPHRTGRPTAWRWRAWQAAVVSASLLVGYVTVRLGERLYLNVWVQAIVLGLLALAALASVLRLRDAERRVPYGLRSTMSDNWAVWVIGGVLGGLLLFIVGLALPSYDLWSDNCERDGGHVVASKDTGGGGPKAYCLGPSGAVRSSFRG
jgi:hypothetical protein